MVRIRKPLRLHRIEVCHHALRRDGDRGLELPATDEEAQRMREMLERVSITERGRRIVPPQRWTHRNYAGEVSTRRSSVEGDEPAQRVASQERCRQCPVLCSNLRQHFMHYEVDEHRRAAGCWILLRVSGVGDGSQVVSAILAVDNANKDELRDSPSSGK